MLKTRFARLLCVLFTISTCSPINAATPPVWGDLNEQAIRSQYPGARIVHVQPEDYPQLAERLSHQGYVVATDGEFGQEQNVDASAPGAHGKDDCDSGTSSKTDPEATEDSFRLIVDVTDDMLRSGNHGGGEGAAIVFVIVGAVVIVVWALYVVKYLYDLAVGFQPCGRWSELTLVSSTISASDLQHIDFDGARFMTGFRDGNMDVGIALELGHVDLLLTEASSLALKGSYWLLGPMLRWRLSSGSNPHYFQMNFMGGSTEHDEVGVLARASLGFRLGLGDHVHVGVSWGAMNVRLNNDQGIISDRDQYHYLYGINAGFGF
jgi:hypothetical protein